MAKEPVGHSSQRNMLVIRKPKDGDGANRIIIYSSKTVNELTMGETLGDDTVTTKPLTLPSNVRIDAPLCLGNYGTTGILSSAIPAKGTIYWAKYWPEDLGLGECKALANWTHEDVEMNIAVVSS